MNQLRCQGYLGACLVALALGSGPASAQSYDCDFSHDCFQTAACTPTRENGRLEKIDGTWRWTPASGTTNELRVVGEEIDAPAHLALIADQPGDWVLLLSLFQDGSLRLTSNFWFQDEARTITLHGLCTAG